MAGYEDEYGKALDQVDEKANALSTLQLGVRGYACHVFDDARAAWSLHREQHLIPWRMESDLRVDRFDARNLLDDKAFFRRLKKPQCSGGTRINCSNDDAAMTDAERELHALRYGDYEVEFPPPVVQETFVENLFPYAYPEDHDDDEETGGEAYEPPWLVPEHLAQPKSKKLHEIISATAKKAREHRQLEVMLKVRMMQWKFAPYMTSSSADELRFLPQVKLSANAKFGFLEPSHGFHAYYAYLRDENPPLRATSLATVAKNVSGGSLLLGEEYGSDSDENAEELKSQPEDTSTVGIETEGSEKPAATDGDDEDKVKKAMRLKRAKLFAGNFQQAALEKKECAHTLNRDQVNEAEAQAAEQGSTSEAAVAAGAEVKAEVEAGDGEANFEVEARRCRDQEEEIEKLRSAMGASENSKAEAIAALRAEVEEFKKTAQLVFVTGSPKRM